MEEHREQILKWLAQAAPGERPAGERPTPNPPRERYARVDRQHIISVPAGFTIFDEATKLDIEGELDIDSAGKLGCVLLVVRRLDGLSLTSENLRSISVRQVWQEALDQQEIFRGESSGQFVQRRAGEVRGLRRRTRFTPDYFTELASVYRAAQAAGRLDPTNAVTEHFDVPRGTAGRHVWRARQEGYLESAPGERIPGEVKRMKKTGRKR